MEPIEFIIRTIFSKDSNFLIIFPYMVSLSQYTDCPALMTNQKDLPIPIIKKHILVKYSN